MAAALDNIAVLHDQDQICILNSRKPVRNDKGSPSFGQAVHGVLYQNLRPGIHGAGGFIQDQDLRIRQDGPGNGQELLLSLGYIAGFLIQFHIIPARQGLHRAGRFIQDQQGGVFDHRPRDGQQLFLPGG